MTKLLRGAAVTLALGGLLAVCAPSQGRSPTPRSKAALSQNQAQNLAVTGQGGTMDLPDPKRSGWMLWHLSFRSVVATLADGAVVAHSVTATTFRNGTADAKIAAPTATGNTGTGTIIATGVVNYVALTQRDTFMRADSVRWNARTQRGMARGHVHYHNGKNGLTMDTPRLYFNSGLRVVSTEPLSP